jgi:hypothetical protein
MRLPKLTRSDAISLLALFFALAGTVYASTSLNGRAIKPGTIPANRLRNDSLTGTQINESSLGAVPEAQTAGRASAATRADTAGRANTAGRADTARTADEAAKATAAANAAALGGVSPAGYQRSCQNGVVKGVVTIDTTQIDHNNPNLFHTFTGAGFNCFGNNIIARRSSPGEYVVEFEGMPVSTAPPSPPATATLLNGTAAVAVKVRQHMSDPANLQPSFGVFVINGNNAPVDDTIFTLVVY